MTKEALSELIDLHWAAAARNFSMLDNPEMGDIYRAAVHRHIDRALVLQRILEEDYD